MRSVAVGYWIGAGSRDERLDRAGASHFIEHLLFKGSERFTAQEIAEIFDGLGGELNAATSREHTVVYARVPDKHVETAIDVVSDMVFAPGFNDVDAEREVVLSAGAYQSPQLLMLSGIGPRADLEKHGIAVRAHLPPVPERAAGSPAGHRAIHRLCRRVRGRRFRAGRPPCGEPAGGRSAYWIGGGTRCMRGRGSWRAGLRW